MFQENESLIVDKLTVTMALFGTFDLMKILLIVQNQRISVRSLFHRYLVIYYLDGKRQVISCGENSLKQYIWFITIFGFSINQDSH